MLFTVKDTRPSLIDAISAVDEAIKRAKGSEFIKKCGEKLSLPTESICTARLYFLRFFMFKSFKHFNYWDIGAACLFLAIKTGTCFRKISTIIQVVSKVASKTDRNIKEGDKEYQAWESNILANELVVICTLCFELDVELVHSWALDLVEEIVGLNEKSRFQLLVFSFCNDIYNTHLPLLLPAETLSYITLYMASNALRIPFSSLKTHNGQSIKEKSRIKREFYRKAEKVVLVFSNLQIGHKYVKRVVEWDDDVYEKQEEETKVESSGCVDGDGEIVDVEMNVERKTFITPSPSSPSKSPFKVLHSPATTVTSTITNSSVIPLPPNPVNAGSSANSVSAATAAAAAIAMKLGSVQVSQYLQHQQPVIFPHHPKPVPVNTGIPPQVQQKYQPKQKIPIPTRPTPIQPPTIPPPPPMMMNIPPVPKLVSHDHDLVPPGTSVPDTNVGSVTPISEVGSKQEQYVPSQGQQIQQQQDQPVQQVQKVHPLPDHPNKKGHYAPFNNHTNSHQHNQQMNHMNHNQHVKRSENRYPNQTWYANGVSASGGGGGGGPIRGNKRIGQANFHTVNGSGQHGSSGHGSVGYQGMGTFGNHGNHGMTGISTGQVFSGQFSGVPNNPNLVTQQQQFQQQGVTRVPPNAMNSVNTMNPMFMRPVFPGGGGGVGATTTGVSNGGMGGQFGYQTGPGFAMGSGYSRVYGEDGKQVNGWMSYGQ